MLGFVRRASAKAQKNEVVYQGSFGIWLVLGLLTYV